LKLSAGFAEWRLPFAQNGKTARFSLFGKAKVPPTAPIRSAALFAKCVCGAVSVVYHVGTEAAFVLIF
jgi:hypothetical protein